MPVHVLSATSGRNPTTSGQAVGSSAAGVTSGAPIRSARSWQAGNSGPRRITCPKCQSQLVATSANVATIVSSLGATGPGVDARTMLPVSANQRSRSEEHTSELQSHHDLVCRLLIEKKKK